MNRSRLHGRTALLLAAAAALLTTLPVIYGLALTPRGSLFLWSEDPYDNNTYFAKMRPGYRGEWLTTNLYSSAPHQPVFLFPFHVLMGHAARGYCALLTALGPAAPPIYSLFPVVYNAIRIMLVVALVFLIYWLAGMMTARPAARLWMTALAVFAGGWGRTCNTEAHILKACVYYPNFTVSLVFYVMVCGAFMMAMRRAPKQWHAVALAAAGGFGLAWVHPFDVLPLGVMSAVALAWRWRMTQRFPGALFTALAGFSALAAAPIGYQMHVKSGEVMWQVIDAQNWLKWDPWYEWLPMLDVYLAAGLLGAASLWPRRRRPEAMFVMVWVLAGLAMINLPVLFQRRMIEGLPLGLAFAVGMGIEAGLLPRLGRGRRKGCVKGTDEHGTARTGEGGGGRPAPRRALRRLRHWTHALVFALLAPRTVWVLYDASLGAFDPASAEQYVPAAEVAAMEWLAAHGRPGDVVWAGPERSNVIPFLAGLRVFYGHDVETAWSVENRLRTERLFGGDMEVGGAEFQAIVQRAEIKFLYYGPLERALSPSPLGVFDPARLGRPAYDNGVVRIYRLPALIPWAGRSGP